MPFSPKIIGNPILPAIHGGMTGAFLETTAIVGVTRELGVSAPPKPIGLTINYLRSGRALDSYAKVSIVKQGRRVVAFEAQAWQDDRVQADRLGVWSFHAEAARLASMRNKRGRAIISLVQAQMRHEAPRRSWNGADPVVDAAIDHLRQPGPPYEPAPQSLD